MPLIKYDCHQRRETPNCNILLPERSRSYRTSRTVLFLARLEQGIFVTQVFAAICLSEAHNAGRVEPPALSGAASADSEAQRDVVHGIDNQALVLGAVFRVSANVGLDDMSTVEEGHDSVGADPELVSRVLGEDGEGSDVDAEFARLGELACRVDVTLVTIQAHAGLSG